MVKKTAVGSSMYQHDIVRDLGAGAQNLTSTGDLVGVIKYAKPQKKAILRATITTEMNGAAVVDLLNASDESQIELTIPSGSTVGSVVESTTSLLSTVDLEAGSYNINVGTAATGGAAIMQVVAREKYDVDVDDDTAS